MPDYSKAKIYTIRCHSNDKLIYVGSTIQSLAVRLAQHKSHNNTMVGMYISEPENKTAWDDWHIELYEMFPCDCKEELSKREYEVIRSIATLNKMGHYLDKKDWFNKHKEQLKEYRQQYYIDHREELLINNKLNYEANKETYMEKSMLYRQANKDKIAEVNRAYREQQDKETVKAYKKEWYAKKKLSQ